MEIKHETDMHIDNWACPHRMMINCINGFAGLKHFRKAMQF